MIGMYTFRPIGPCPCEDCVALRAAEKARLDAETARMVSEKQAAARERFAADAAKARTYSADGPATRVESGAVRDKPDPMRQTYRDLRAGDVREIAAIKDAGESFLRTIATRTPREFAIARTKIEEAVMWAVKGVTA